MNTIKRIIITFRPRQIPKNFVALFPLFFAVPLWWDIDSPIVTLSVIWRGVVAFITFVLLSGSLYVLNDVLDVERDRLHPRKKYRPIASGRLSVKVALAVAIVSTGAAIFSAFALSMEMGYVVLIYLFMNIAYSVFLKLIVIIDVMVIAFGFVIRAVGGTFALESATPAGDLPISPWLYVVTFLGALFLALNKRRAESVDADATETSDRRSLLREYSVPMLDQMINIVAAATLISYSLYSFNRDTGRAVSSDSNLLMITIPFVFYGLFRYMYLAHKYNKGEYPEDLLLRDRPIQVCVVLWLIVSSAVLILGG